MPKLQVDTVRTLQDFVEIIANLTTTPASPYWYRGTSKITHGLLPSLYRHPIYKSANELLALERKLIVRFKERSRPYLAVPLTSDWEYLFLMQHFGIPTRLLDWTENPFIALFFALSVASQHPVVPFHEGAAVWVLSPRVWNQQAFSLLSFKGDVLSITDTELGSYDPNITKGIGTPLNPPAAIYGVHNSPRIVAQRGVFTIFGSQVQPMEEIFEEPPFTVEVLQKLEVPHDAGEDLFRSILALGYTDSVIFPDLEGLAREMKRQFGF